MTEHTLASLTAAAAQHPAVALGLVGLFAFAESLAVVGTFVPAAVLMFAAGVLVGQGSLDLGPTLAIAAAGAVAGDAMSYELGRHPRIRDRVLRLAARRPGLLARGEELMARRGALSVVVARFTGPLRAFVPLLAGIARMPRASFYGTNIASALLWAPAHILPGSLFGSSLQLAKAVSGRLAMLLVLLVLALGATVWAVTGLRRRVVPLVQRWRLRLVQHLQARDGRGARLLAAALAPAAAGSKGLVTGACVLLAAGWLFFAVLEDVATQDPLVQADLSVFAFLQQLRTDAADQAAIVITEAGSIGVLLPLIVVVLAWLVARRCWRAAGYWVASAAFAEGLVQVLKHGLARQRPSLLYAGTERFSFPSGHATMSAVVLGLLAFLLTRGQSQRWRSVVMGTVAVYVVLVAFSRLYLGAHWFSDVAGGMSLGLAWVAFVALVYNQRGTRQEPLAPRALALVSLLTLAVSLLLWNQWRGPVDQQMYAVVRQPRLLPEAAWLDGGWRAVPLRRRELAGDEEEPFTLQWACDAAGVRQALGAVGWQPAVPWAPASALLALAGPGELGRLPVLPRFDQGRRSALRFVRLAPDAKGTREVLQLWQADVEVVTASGARLPVWYGTTYAEHWSRRGVPRLQPVTPEAAILAQQLHSAAGLHRQGVGASWPELLVCPAGEPVVRQAPSRP